MRVAQISEKVLTQPMREPRVSSFTALSVIVVTYNSAAVLPECLNSLSKHLPDAEVVIVDNGSQDATVDLADRGPLVRLVAGHGNVGFGAAVNRGAQAAAGSLLLVLNPDAAVVAVDHSELKTLSGDPITGLVGCRARGTGMDRYLISNSWDWKAELFWLLGQHFLVPRELTLRRPRLTFKRRSQWIAGAAFVVRRSEFLEAGGFDDTFFLYFEDVDLSRTYNHRRLPIRTTDAFTVSHIGQGSSPRDEDTMTSFALLSLIQYVDKWEGSGAARDAATWCLRLLRMVEATGTAFESVPVLGPRAAKKRDSAAVVRSYLAKAGVRSPIAGAYGAASDAIRGALSERHAAGPRYEPS